MVGSTLPRLSPLGSTVRYKQIVIFTLLLLNVEVPFHVGNYKESSFPHEKSGNSLMEQFHRS